MLGTPVQSTTKDFIEAQQRILRRAYLRTNLVNADAQIMRRIMLLKYIDGVVEPSLRKQPAARDGNGEESDEDDGHLVVAALQSDKHTQAYLQGSVKAIPGVNTVYAPPDSAEQVAWNGSIVSAMKACATFLIRAKDSRLPKAHVAHVKRIHPRSSVFVCRRGLCARSVPAYSDQCVAGVAGATSEHAIFSVYEQIQVPVAGGVAAAQPLFRIETVESERFRFIVDGWFSYDIRELSAAYPNIEPPAKPLSKTDLNGVSCIDLCIGRWLEVLPTVTGSGIEDRESAAAIFQRVKPQDTLQILEIGELCQPLWAFPWFGDYATSREFFSRSDYTKWDAEQWLIASKLY
jgi:hypothetical protein